MFAERNYSIFTKKNGYPLWHYLREKEFVQGRKKLLFLYSVQTEDFLAILEVKNGEVWYSLNNIPVIDDNNIVQEWIRDYAYRKRLYFGCKWFENLARKGYLGVRNKYKQFVMDTMRNSTYENT